MRQLPQQCLFRRQNRARQNGSQREVFSASGSTGVRRKVIWSGEHAANDLAMHIGQAEIATGMALGQLLVIQAHRVQNRRV